MSRARFDIVACLVVTWAIAAYAPASARAGGHEDHGCCGRSACLGPPAYTLTTAGVFPPERPWCYQIPIQAVYQMPAVMANQPGAQVIWLGPHPESGFLGGRPYLYHP